VCLVEKPLFLSTPLTSQLDHDFAGRWRTDVGEIDDLDDLGGVAVRLDLDRFHGCSLGGRDHRIASATSCSNFWSSKVATSVTFAFPNCPNSEDGLSYSTQVFPSSVS